MKQIDVKEVSITIGVGVSVLFQVGRDDSIYLKEKESRRPISPTRHVEKLLVYEYDFDARATPQD